MFHPNLEHEAEIEKSVVLDCSLGYSLSINLGGLMKIGDSGLKRVDAENGPRVTGQNRGISGIFKYLKSEKK